MINFQRACQLNYLCKYDNTVAILSSLSLVMNGTGLILEKRVQRGF